MEGKHSFQCLKANYHDRIKRVLRKANKNMEHIRTYRAEKNHFLYPRFPLQSIIIIFVFGIKKNLFLCGIKSTNQIFDDGSTF